MNYLANLLRKKQRDQGKTKLKTKKLIKNHKVVYHWIYRVKSIRKSKQQCSLRSMIINFVNKTIECKILFRSFQSCERNRTKELRGNNGETLSKLFAHLSLSSVSRQKGSTC